MNINFKKISFVIPCYYSEKTIATVCSDILAVMGNHCYEVILVNDGSTDGTWDVISKLCKYHHQVKGLNLSRNFGQHSAIMAGLNHASGDIVVLLDDDGENDPKQVMKLIDALDDKTDVVIAEYTNKVQSGFRNFGTWINNLMAEVMIQKPKHLTLTSYIAMKRYVTDEMIRYQCPYPYVDGLILRATTNIATVEIEHHPRLVGTSTYSLKKLMVLWFNGFTSFSIVPLRISTVFGVLCAFIGFLVGCYAILSKIVNPEISAGWPSLISAITIIGGMILIVLGMIGEYVGRIYISLNNSPQYVIKEKRND